MIHPPLTGSTLVIARENKKLQSADEADVVLPEALARILG
jgi:hypothetical protein